MEETVTQIITVNVISAVKSSGALWDTKARKTVVGVTFCISGGGNYSYRDGRRERA